MLFPFSILSKYEKAKQIWAPNAQTAHSRINWIELTVILQILTFKSNGGSSKISLVKGQETANSSHMRHSLVVPYVAPTLDTRSTIIKVKYEVVVTFCISVPHLNTDVIIPIRIVTMPFTTTNYS